MNDVEPSRFVMARMMGFARAEPILRAVNVAWSNRRWFGVIWEIPVKSSPAQSPLSCGAKPPRFSS